VRRITSWSLVICSISQQCRALQGEYVSSAQALDQAAASARSMSARLPLNYLYSQPKEMPEELDIVAEAVIEDRTLLALSPNRLITLSFLLPNSPVHRFR
jgi:hypothetical protein